MKNVATLTLVVTLMCCPALAQQALEIDLDAVLASIDSSKFRNPALYPLALNAPASRPRSQGPVPQPSFWKSPWPHLIIGSLVGIAIAITRDGRTGAPSAARLSGCATSGQAGASPGVTASVCVPVITAGGNPVTGTPIEPLSRPAQ